MQFDWKRTFRLITCVSEFLQIWGLHRNTENHNVFILKCIEQKVIRNWKNLRNPIFGSFWVIFTHFWKTVNFLKIRLYQFWVTMVLWLHAQYQKNNRSRFREKCITDWQTDGWLNKGTHRQIENPKFIEPFCEGEFKIQTFAKHQNILRWCPISYTKIFKSTKNHFCKTKAKDSNCKLQSTILCND